MTTLRVSRATLATSNIAKLRVAGVSMTGAAPAVARLRVARARVTGGAAAIPIPVAPITVDPGRTVTLSLSIYDGVVPDSWVWTQTAGAPVGFSGGTGGTRTFVAPSVVNGSLTPSPTTLRFNVQAVVGSFVSPPLEVVVNVLPQILWERAGSRPYAGVIPPSA